MILVDSSAWIEFLRGTGSPACTAVREALAGEVAVCDPVRMEVLAGARSETQLADLRRLLARATVLPTAPQHYDDAAQLFRTACARGLTVRRMIDCLIAAVAIDNSVPVLHADRDFEALAAVSRLALHP